MYQIPCRLCIFVLYQKNKVFIFSISTLKTPSAMHLRTIFIYTALVLLAFQQCKSRKIWPVERLAEASRHTRKLDLSGSNLQSLPPEVLRMSKLRYLDLSSNPLLDWPTTFAQIKQMKHLEELVLSQNPQVRWESQLNNLPALPRLESLHLATNALQEVPLALQNFKNLQYLNLSDNALQSASLPARLAALPRLEILILSQCRLSTLPEGFGKLLQLRGLDLSQNQLSELPPDLLRLPALRMLTLSYNLFSTFPTDLLLLQANGTLLLNGNQLKSLPDALQQRSFFLLDLRDNAFEESEKEKFKRLLKGSYILID